MFNFVVATRNQHKVEEISAILGPVCRLQSLVDFPGAPTVVEDAPDFAGNATKKAVSLADWLSEARPQLHRENFWVLADDSGLEVDALQGAPGVHSARFAAPELERNSPDAENNALLLRLLQEVPAEKRTARFRCVIAVAPLLEKTRSNKSAVCHASETELLIRTFEGRCEGSVAERPAGPGGFGYDPLFIPFGFLKSFGELDAETKNKISHRAHALAKLRRALEETPEAFRPGR